MLRNVSCNAGSSGRARSSSYFNSGGQPLARGRTLSKGFTSSQVRASSQARPKSPTQFSSQSRSLSQVQATSQVQPKLPDQFPSQSRPFSQVQALPETGTTSPALNKFNFKIQQHNQVKVSDQSKNSKLTTKKSLFGASLLYLKSPHLFILVFKHFRHQTFM